MSTDSQSFATKDDIRLLLHQLAAHAELTGEWIASLDKRIGLTQVRIVESEERVKRHVDLVSRAQSPAGLRRWRPAAGQGPNPPR